MLADVRAAQTLATACAGEKPRRGSALINPNAINLFNGHNGPDWDDRRYEINGSFQSESTLVSADVTQGDDCLASAYAGLAYVV